jgi:hypothetical protein
MSNRTWTCVPCRKSYRRVQTTTSLECPGCHGPCEYVHWKIRVPSPKRTKAWEEFWAKYKVEKALLDAFHRGELRQDVKLELLNVQLHVTEPAPALRAGIRPRRSPDRRSPPPSPHRRKSRKI